MSYNQQTQSIDSYTPTYENALLQAKPDFLAILKTSLFDLNYQRECYYVRSLIEKNWYECGTNLRYALACCTPASIQLTLVMAAHAGLSFNPSMRLVYLVPRINSKTKALECTLSISWRGLIQSGISAKAITSATPTLVYENDEFRYNGTDAIPHHVYDPFDTVAQRGKIRGGYCIAKLTNGDVMCTAVSSEKILELRPTHASVWDSSLEEMMLKSLVRKSYNAWPIPLTFSARREAETLPTKSVLEGQQENLIQPPASVEEHEELIVADSVIEHNSTPQLSSQEQYMRKLQECDSHING